MSATALGIPAIMCAYAGFRRHRVVTAIESLGMQTLRRLAGK